MPDRNQNITYAAFSAYLQKEGIEGANAEPRVEGGKYHYSGSKGGQDIKVTFDTGTKPDGTYNIFTSINGQALSWAGVIRPLSENAYTVRAAKDGPEVSYDLTPQKKAPPPVRQAPPSQTSIQSGQYHILIVREGPTSNPKLETGRIVITDPNFTIMADCRYQSGPYGKGCAPKVDKYRLSRDIQPFIVDETGQTQEGLRISDQSFAHCKSRRSGILIHEDKNTVGTLGCYGVRSDDWADFKKAWESIPRNIRPPEMQPIGRQTYERLKAIQPHRRAEAEQSYDERFAQALAAALNPDNDTSSTIPYGKKPGSTERTL